MSEQEQDQVGVSSAETVNTAPAERMIPKSRFDEVNKELQALRTAAQRREQEERTAADEQAKQKGEWERLATERQARLEKIESELPTVASRAEAYAAAMEAQIKARVKALPEELRDLMPEGDVLTRYDQLGKLEAAAAKLTLAPPAPRGTPPGGGRTTPSSAPNMDAIIAEKRARMGGL